MKRRKSKTRVPRIRLVGVPAPVGAAAVAVAGLTGSVALAAPGDLDPTFGQVGRRSDIANPGVATLNSVEIKDDDGILFGGGGEYDYYYSYVEDFLGGLLPDGSSDTGFAAASLDNAAVYDTALQPDGKVVGVGVVHQADGKQKLLIFRRLSDGALDAGFGLSGLVVISDGTSSREVGYSVIVDPDGSIVVAGGRNDKLLVARTTADGTLDGSFGTGGLYLGASHVVTTGPIARAPAGGYRLVTGDLLNNQVACKIIGLTPAGALDATFGSNGSVAPQAGGTGLKSCTGLAVQGDGRIVVGGYDGDHAFVGRLLANGTADTGFDAASVPAQLRGVAALGVGATGKVFVAGPTGPTGLGAQVLRLLPTGAPDPLYGNAGVATVDPEVRRGFGYWLTDLAVGRNDSIVLAGNTNSYPNGSQAFLARLIGDSPGAGGPGVFSMVVTRVLVTEASGQAVVKVRRTGGSAGAVAVSYDTRPFPMAVGGGTYAPGASASLDDYTASTGRLTWADGDSGEREIIVPINVDPQTERPEWFELLLQAPEGGAGLGFHSAEVEIAGSSYPYGDFSIVAGTNSAGEGEVAPFYVSRDFYGQGSVSVTVRVAAGGTATSADDFRGPSGLWQDVVFTWQDGEYGSKYLPVPIVADGTAEAAETFTLELVSPTGGALVGSASQATMQIVAQAAPTPPAPQPPKSNGGGGALGWLGALLLALGGALRRLRRQHGGMTNA